MLSGGGGLNNPLLNTKNHCKKQIFFAFQIGHIEIGKSRNFGVFGGHFEGLRADLRVKYG